MLKNGPWLLSDLNNIPKNNYKVFSCFHCGGGSSMGYKLAGFTVLGGVEIDPEMMEIYKANHHPKYSYLMGVQEFKNIANEKLPEELFNLDVLDGSPPCSSFSMAGARENKWGKEKKFREGQANQILDDLFFHYIEIANKLKPKIVVAENVKGLIQGNARYYVKQIFEAFNQAGYETQLFLLNAATMGVPQKRERTFFIARRKNLNLNKIKLEFNEKIISCGQAFEGILDCSETNSEDQKKWWILTKKGESFSKNHPKGSWFNSIKLSDRLPANTLAASGGAGGLYHWKFPRKINQKECIRIQTFPDDYNFLEQKAQYLCGMSVPPFMMQRIALQIKEQLLDKIINN